MENFVIGSSLGEKETSMNGAGFARNLWNQFWQTPEKYCADRMLHTKEAATLSGVRHRK